MSKITSITKVEPSFSDVRSWYEQNMGLDTIDLNDQEVYKHVYEDGHFPIIFQLTSKGAQNLFKKAKPKSIMDIAALTSIYRPGPLSARVHDLWVKHEHEPYDWGHPLINEVLKETRGLLIFQEDVMNLAHYVGGFPMEKCDEVRRAIMKRSTSGGEEAKKKALALEDDFMNGAIKNSVPEEIARKAYANILFFAGYGFNCLSATSFVKTKERGTVSIKDVIPGEHVLSENGYVKVLNQLDQGVNEVYELRTESGKTLRCTIDHKIMTPFGLKSLKEIMSCKCEHVVTTTKLLDEIVSIKKCAPEMTYDLTVDHPDHTFFANDISVSNCSHATAYAIDSFYCSWLFTKYPDEWLATYLESVSSDEDKALAVSQVKELGYKVMSLDVNYSSSKWVCIKEKKTFVPSFLSCKGVGAAAVAELMSLRPFDSLEHMLYNADGTWRFSKFNKRGFEALVKLRAFESLDCVGEDKLFKSYKGMHEVLMDGKIRHCKKNDPHIGMRTMYELARTVGQCDEWSKKELASFMLEITGAIDTVSLIDKAVFERLDAKGIKPINMCQEGAKDLYYFVCVRSLLKKTKAGKSYVCADTLGIGTKNVKINVWGANQDLVPFALYVAECERNDFGVSTRIHKCKEVTV
jgi:DNA polymerase III alpha subunit